MSFSSTSEVTKSAASASVVAIKIVNSIEEACDHIKTYGTLHTEAIVNENAYKNESEVVAEFADFDMAEKFLNTYGFEANQDIGTGGAADSNGCLLYTSPSPRDS